ncbi:MAG: hypothetical protein K1Y02_09540, partial [Candidatus Hydrogenedentes bacterium]|nr:hypothetical protein [Candidatus Hydrogenedentota bacterium]
RAIAFLELAKVLATLLLGLFVVPRYGAWGMAWVIAAVKGGVGIATYLVAARYAQMEESGTGTAPAV